MRLESDDSYLELERSTLGEPDGPEDNDILLNLTVRVSGYSAADQFWVTSDDWHRFIQELNFLENRRDGKATLQGADPGDLTLEFYSTDSAGHLAINGNVGWIKSDGHQLRLLFGFGFSADNLPYVVRELSVLGDGNWR